MKRELPTVAILAGGLATRMRPLTERIPKSLLEVGGEPFVLHQLRLLAAQGGRRVVLCCGYLGEMVRECVGDGSEFGLEVSYSFDGPELRGTGGAIGQAMPWLGEWFLTLYGDSFLTADLGEAAAAFERSGKGALMTVYQNEGRWDTSNVEFAGGVIVEYDKKRRTERMRHIDYGLGGFRRGVWEQYAPEGRAYDLAEMYQRLLGAGELYGYEVKDRFYEIGSIEGLRELNEYLSCGEDAR